MGRLRPFGSYDELLDYLEFSGLELTKVARDWQGNWVVVAGSLKLSRALLTAGAHGDEHAGVVAAASLATDFWLPTVPARDPSGVNGFLYALEFLTDRKPPKGDYADIFRFVRETADWVYESEGFIVGIYDIVAVCAMPPASEWKGEDEVNERLSSEMEKNPELRERLEGMRVIMPANLPRSEGVGLFDRSFTSFVVDGEVRNLNWLFDKPDGKVPSEFRGFRRLLLRYAPKVVLDLHEGYGERFYVFAPLLYSESDGDLARVYRDVLSAIKEALDERSLEYVRPDESPEDMPERKPLFEDGDIAAFGLKEENSRFLSGFARFKLNAFSLTFETGMRAPFSNRVLSHKWAAYATLRKLREDGILP